MSAFQVLNSCVSCLLKETGYVEGEDICTKNFRDVESERDIVLRKDLAGCVKAFASSPGLLLPVPVWLEAIIWTLVATALIQLILLIAAWFRGESMKIRFKTLIANLIANAFIGAHWLGLMPSVPGHSVYRLTQGVKEKAGNCSSKLRTVLPTKKSKHVDVESGESDPEAEGEPAPEAEGDGSSTTSTSIYAEAMDVV